MRSYLGAIVAIVATFYMAIIYENPAMVLFGMMEIFLTLFSIVTLCYQVCNLKVQLHIPIMLGELNVPVHLQAFFTNRSKVGCQKVKLKMQYGRSSRKQKKAWFQVQEVIPGESTHIFPVELTSSGAYTFEIRKMRVYDWFGIFYWNKKVTGKKHVQGKKKVIVLPQVHEVSVLLGASVVNFFGDSEYYDEFRPGYDPSETFDVRQFRDGDKLQSVHWKLSAKSDELMVRENSLPKACAVVILLEEQALEWAMSISFSLLEQKCPHFAAWRSERSGELVRVRVEDEESFYTAFTLFLQDYRNVTYKELKPAYEEKYRGDLHVHVLGFEGRNGVYVDEEDYSLKDFETFELMLP